MISVWGKFNPNTANSKEMDGHGFLYKPNLSEHILDARLFTADGRRLADYFRPGFIGTVPPDQPWLSRTGARESSRTGT